MKSVTGFNRTLLLTAAILVALGAKAQLTITENNPGQHAILLGGNALIRGKVSDQTRRMQEIAALQGTMAAEYNRIKHWEHKYNGYLKTTRGYAEMIKAGTTLVAEGVDVLRNIYELTRIQAQHPEGVAATLAMGDLYQEAAVEIIRGYSIISKVMAVGGQINMLTNAERTELLWMVEENIQRLNSKLRQLTISVAYASMADVWFNATAGIVNYTTGDIAQQALGRWRRSSRLAHQTGAH